MERNNLEALLANVLVPVEPSLKFTKRLRARLVNYRGGRPFSGWTAIVVVASVVLMAAGMIGMAVRIISAWVHLVGAETLNRQKAAG
ncbi:MAG: hypothetical protein JXA97_00510 [Anaerolineales bacterium]|nr:hypothetical protein [Anaerolineales bacterium]